MYDPVSQGVETGSEPGFVSPSMSFASDCFPAHCLACAAAGPCDGHGDDGDKACQLFGIGDVGIFKVEATPLGVGEQALDPPPAAICVEGLAGASGIGGDDDEFTLSDPPGSETKTVLRHHLHASEPTLPYSATALAQEGSKLSQTCVLKRDQHILLDADREGDIVFIEESHPLSADELPVGKQYLDGGCPKQSQIALNQTNAFIDIGCPLLVQHRPHQGYSKAVRHHRQHENIDVPVAEFPVGPIEYQASAFIKFQHTHHNLCNKIAVKPDILKKALQAAVV